VTDLARNQLGMAAQAARLATSPRRCLGLAERAVRTLADSARPARPVDPLNQPNSSRRHLALHSRPVDDLRRIKEAFGTKLNDVVLAASAGAIRRFLKRRGQTPITLKTMVPVNVRGEAKAGELGNRISFMFVDLPCEEPDPERRLRRVHAETSERKRAGRPQGADDVVRSIGLVPRPVQRAVSRFIASPRAFNLAVSNIPGPRQPLFMRGCELKEAYPVVPLPDRHALSIGVTNVQDGLCFGLYADRESLPDAHSVAEDLEESIDELLELSSQSENHIALGR
jgi:diacylglycerol O-acyltransferase / wax synthase